MGVKAGVINCDLDMSKPFDIEHKELGSIEGNLFFEFGIIRGFNDDRMG